METRSFPLHKPFPARSKTTGEPITVFGVDDSKVPHKWLAAADRKAGLTILHLDNCEVDVEADEDEIYPWKADAA